jgi:4-alpha-glucanotransferase
MRANLPQADAWGIMNGYEDALHRRHRVSRRTRAMLRKAMGASDGRREPPARFNVLTLRAGETRRLPGPVEVTLEDGTLLRLEHKLPRDLPVGYHTLRTPGKEIVTHLIIHPGRCCLPEDSQQWGWALQLYSLRSHGSWGIGDFADLRDFAKWSGRKLDAGFILLNPVGAPLPGLPQEASPYFPSSRLYLNPLYLRVKEVPGAVKLRGHLEKIAAAGRKLNENRLINRDAIFQLKLRALEMIYAAGPFSKPGSSRGNEAHSKKSEIGNRKSAILEPPHVGCYVSKHAAAFERYRAEQGETLRRFSTFCVLAEHHVGGWRKWPTRLRHPASPAVHEFTARHQCRVRFYEWLQWLLDEQLARASRELPPMLDVPIGVNPDGFDAWLWQDALALGASVGAPPDEYNTLGQNWGLPPFIPHRLRAAGYEPFRLTLRAMLRHARGLRIDHVMGLFRLFWIPRDAAPRDGGYVRYPVDELLAVLAIESQRAKAVIVGEDLGTVERGVRAKLRRQNVLSYRLLWFEKTPPEKYPRPALAAITTHDLPTTAGLWSGKDLETQERLGLHPNAAGTEAIRRRLRRGAGLKDKASPREAILGAYRLLARTPCRMITATLDDALAVEERPNMPGTTTQWPNWSIALPKPLEEIKRDGLVGKLATLIARGGKAPVNRNHGIHYERHTEPMVGGDSKRHQLSAD